MSGCGILESESYLPLDSEAFLCAACSTTDHHEVFGVPGTGGNFHLPGFWTYVKILT